MWLVPALLDAERRGCVAGECGVPSEAARLPGCRVPSTLGLAAARAASGNPAPHTLRMPRNLECSCLERALRTLAQAWNKDFAAQNARGRPFFPCPSFPCFFPLPLSPLSLEYQPLPITIFFPSPPVRRPLREKQHFRLARRYLSDNSHPKKGRRCKFRWSIEHRAHRQFQSKHHNALLFIPSGGRAHLSFPH